MAPTQTAHESKFLFEVKGVSYQTAVLGLKLFEGVSSPFALHVSLVSEDEINFNEMVGKEAILTLLGDLLGVVGGLVIAVSELGLTPEFWR